MLSAVQTRKRKRDSDALEQDSTNVSPNPASPDLPLDSPSANVDDENSVEALLTTCSISQVNGSTESLVHEIPDEDTELQYPSSDDVGPGETTIASSTELAGPSRSASEPILIDIDPTETNHDDSLMDVDEPSEVAVRASSAVPCTSFYASADKGKQRAESSEVSYTDSSTLSTIPDVPTVNLDETTEEQPGVDNVVFQADK